MLTTGGNAAGHHESEVGNMKLKKLLKNMLDLQQVTIYAVDTLTEYFRDECVTEILNCSFYNLTGLGNMKVKEIFTEVYDPDVICIGIDCRC